VEYTPDTKLLNTGVFTFYKEDHTVGNLLRCQLLRDQRVLFAGYRMPHPLINHTLLRVSTVPETSPGEVSADAAEILAEEFLAVRQAFHDEIQRAHNELTSFGPATMGTSSTVGFR